MLVKASLRFSPSGKTTSEPGSIFGLILMKPNDLLVIPSAWEGDGLVVVEALSRNIPTILNKVGDLTRFDLPDKHYCSGVKEFVERINQNEKDLPSLIAGSEYSEKLSQNRNPELVASKWIEYLAKVK